MKGVVGVATAKIGRYRVFDKCLYKTEMPEGTRIDWQESNFISGNYNAMCRTTLEGDYDWLWILGDDHVWHPLLLRALLERDVDVVVPLCVGRGMPWRPVIYEDRKEDYLSVNYDWLKGKSGLIKIEDKTLGNAGMLIKRHVLEQLDDPWFENGKTHPEHGGCDMWFCQKVLDAGLELYLDMDNLIGHLTYAIIIPVRDSDGMYRPKMRPANIMQAEETSDMSLKGCELNCG
jgi:hypothetical protein